MEVILCFGQRYFSGAVVASDENNKKSVIYFN